MHFIKCVIIGQKSFNAAICEYLRVPSNLNTTLELCDAPSWMFNDNGCHLSYLEADIFLICYSVLDLSSFRNIRQLWMPAIRRYFPQVPVILVGTDAYSWQDKKRLIGGNPLQSPITHAQGWYVAYEIGAWAYKELICLEYEDVEAVFELIIECVTKNRLKTKRRKRSCRPLKCTIL